MNRNSLKFVVLAMLLLTLLIQACAPTPAETEAPAKVEPTVEPTAEVESPPETVKLKVVVLPYISYAPFYIARDDGHFAEQGIEVEFVRFDKSSDAIPALAQGQVDVAAGLMEVNSLNAIAKGTNLKYVADKGYLPQDHCTFTGWVAPPDMVASGELDDLNNLAGMKIAFSPAGSAEYALDMLLKDTGLTSADVQGMDMPPPVRFEGLGDSVDIVSMAEPWILRTVKSGKGVSWVPWEDYMPDFQLSIIMYGPNLLDKNPEVGKRFMVAYLNAIKQYNEGKTDRNVEIAAEFTQLDTDTVKAACWSKIRENGSIDLKQIYDFQDWAFDKGYVDSKMTEEDFWDGSFIEYAYALVK